MNKIKTFAKYLKESKKIVFFTGAGVSTESGIPDFRSANGIYNQKFKNLNPVDIVSNYFLYNEPELFFEFYFKYLIYQNAKPNFAHKFFNTLKNKQIVVVTQNIDNLHQLGGSQIVYELHGSVERNYCIRCNKTYDLNYVLKFQNTIPRCSECNAMVRPDVTLFGEQLNQTVVENAIKAISEADMLIVAGTSLEVYPANMYINYYSKDKFVLINKDKTKFDNLANLVFNDSIVKVLKEVDKELERNNHEK